MPSKLPADYPPTGRWPRPLVQTIHYFFLLFLLNSCSSFLDTQAPDPAPLSAVKLQPATQVNTYQALISWEKSADQQFSGYQVYFDTVPGVTNNSRLAGAIVFKDTTRFLLSGLEHKTQYHVKLYTRSANAFTASNEISFMTNECKTGIFSAERDAATGMVLVPSGCFSDGNGYTSIINNPFYIDTTEVTRQQWSKIMGDGSNSSIKPVTSITWFEAIRYCNKLSKLLGRDTCYIYKLLSVTKAIGLQCDFTRNGFRLPTEDEWEYAYRAGSATDFHWGQNCTDTTPNNPGCKNIGSLKINDFEWWSGNNHPPGIKPVAGKLPNAFGLYDMGGNAMELIWDNEMTPKVSGERLKDRTDFRGSTQGEGHVIRGGSFQEKAYKLTAGIRGYAETNFSKIELGFRVVSTKSAN